MLYFRDAVMTYKCTNNLAPEYLSTSLESCRIKKKAYNTKSKVELRPPKCRIKNAERSFVVRACKLRNMLEEQEKQLESLPLFKKAVKKRLHDKFSNILTLKVIHF